MTPATLSPPGPKKAVLQGERLLSVEEFVRDYSDRRAELIDGRVVELPMPGSKHGYAIGRIAMYLGVFVDANQLGRIFCNDTFVVTKRNPISVRGMDVGYVSYRLWSKKRELDDGPVPVTPELIFEVLSPTDRKKAVAEKVKEYLKAGAITVVVVDPKAKTAKVFRKKNAEEAFAADEILTLPDVLPGFSVPVAKFFE